MIEFVRPKRALPPIGRPLAEYTIEELRARTYGDKPYTAVDAALLLLHEAKVPKIPSDETLRDLAWIMQVMRAPMRRRDQPQGKRLHDRKAISRRDVARCLDTLHPWLAPAYRSAFVRRAPWHDTVHFLAAWYRTHIDREAGNSSAGPLTRFVKLLLERTGTVAVTTAAIQQCLSPSPSRRNAATKVPRHRHA